ncbi:MAG: hypothetical protein MZW92_40190 [Comamonadaceae bacterium]|nr:hypothetical protein [Comamonadaceae bacterium]
MTLAGGLRGHQPSSRRLPAGGPPTAAPVQPVVEVPTLGVPGLAALIALMGLAYAAARRQGS